MSRPGLSAPLLGDLGAGPRLSPLTLFVRVFVTFVQPAKPLAVVQQRAHVASSDCITRMHIVHRESLELQGTAQ